MTIIKKDYQQNQRRDGSSRGGRCSIIRNLLMSVMVVGGIVFVALKGNLGSFNYNSGTSSSSFAPVLKKDMKKQHQKQQAAAATTAKTETRPASVVNNKAPAAAAQSVVVKKEEEKKAPAQKPQTPVVQKEVPKDTTTTWQALLQHAVDIGHRKAEFETPEAREACGRYIKPWILEMSAKTEKKIFSQYGEDGITKHILKNLNLLDNNSNNKNDTTEHFYVEFGVENGKECNTRFLREQHNWTGLMLDGGFSIPDINLQREMIRADNIVELFQKYKVPKNLGLLSEDTDFADYYIWRSMLEGGYRARMLISEFNSNFMGGGSGGLLTTTNTTEMELESATVHAPPAGQVRRWDGKDYYGVSALALKRLWNKHGYIMIYCTKEQVNCFGIHASDALLDDNDESNRIAGQECLWSKPLAWASKMHPCNPKFETYSQVDPDGNIVENSQVTPIVVQHCRTKLHAKN